MKIGIIFGIILFSAVLLVITTNDSAFAHKNGCHSKHSCPSDTGSYECGDKGYCSQCPDNNYCKAGQPSSSSSSEKKQSMSSQLGCKGKARCINGTVIKIVDGDTLDVKEIVKGIEKNYRIRLSLTDTPEKKDKKAFEEATAFTTKLCPVGSVVIVDQNDKQLFDVHKRLVGKVICSGKVLNSELLYSRHAKISTMYCSKSEFSSEPWAKTFGCK